MLTLVEFATGGNYELRKIRIGVRERTERTTLQQTQGTKPHTERVTAAVAPSTRREARQGPLRGPSRSAPTSERTCHDVAC